MEIQIPHGLKLFSRTRVFFGCKYRRFYFFLFDAPASLSIPAPADSYRDDGDRFTCEWFDQTQRSLDLRRRLAPELKSFGANYVKSPNMDKLAAQGRPFHRHYVQAPTCGASRYTLLTGKYGPSHNGALFARSNHIQSPSFPAWFRKNGYVTVSVGKVSHHPGGRGGTDWNEDDKPEMPESWDRHLLPAGTLAAPPWRHARFGQWRNSQERQGHGRLSGL